MSNKLYEGPATITKLDFIAPRYEQGLSEDDIENGFEIMFELKLGDTDNIARVFLEFTNRNGVGKMADKTQKQMSLETLKTIGLVGEEGNMSDLKTAVGKVVSVWQKESTKINEQTGEPYVNTYFSKSTLRKLTSNDVKNRIAAMMKSVKDVNAGQIKADVDAGIF
jgi:hypothetical protein